MEQIFAELLNMSLAASIIVVAVIALRLIFMRVPKWIHCAMWTLVAFRLVCPFSYECDLSLMPSEKIISTVEWNYEVSQESEQSLTESAGLSLTEAVGSPEQGRASDLSKVHGEMSLCNPSAEQNLIHVGMYVWLIGLTAIAAYGVISYILLRRRVAEAVRLRDNIYQCDRICSPFMMGFVSPKIYLPFGMSEQSMKYVIAHEQAHIIRRDYLTKIFGFALTAVHWFNPMIWLAYILLCRDIEMACDERVICGRGADERKLYSMALLTCAVENPIKIHNAVPIAFCEVGVKRRVVNVVKNKKTTVLVVCAALAACVAVGALLLTNGRSDHVKVSEALDKAVSQAIFDYNFVNEVAECYGEGHIIYDVEEKEGSVNVYALCSCECYMFENDNLVVDWKHDSVPTVITFEVDDGNYTYKSHEEIRRENDFFGTISSIKEKFPENAANKIIDASPEDLDKLTEQCREYARAYLKSVGRIGKVGEESDFQFKTLWQDYGVSESVVEFLYDEYTDYYFVNNMGTGKFEQVENGVRFIYLVNWDGNNSGRGKLELRKYRHDNREDVESFIFDIWGDDIVLCSENIYDLSNSTRLRYLDS